MKPEYQYGRILYETGGIPPSQRDTLVYIKIAEKGNRIQIKHDQTVNEIYTAKWKEIPGDGLLPGDMVKRVESGSPSDFFYIHRMEWDYESESIQYQLRQKMRPHSTRYTIEDLVIPRKQKPSVKNPELEDVIQANLHDEDAWSVYGDWLSSLDDPLGEVIALEIARRKNPENQDISLRIQKLNRTHRPHWVGEILDIAGETPKSDPILKLKWLYGHIQKAEITGREQYPVPPGLEIFTSILDSPAAKFLTDLKISPNMKSPNPFNDFLSAIIVREPRVALRTLILSDHYQFQLENDVFRHQELFDRLPNLEELEIQGPSVFTNPLTHKNLKRLTLRIPDKRELTSMENLARSEFPNLELLDITLHSDPSDPREFLDPVRPLTTSKFLPRLKHLTIRGIQAEYYLTNSLIPSPLLKRLKSLTVMSREYEIELAEVFLDNRKSLKHLKKIEIRNNSISLEERDVLKKVFGNSIHVTSLEAN